MRQNGRVQVVIVDDQAIFRDAARHWLTARGYDVVAEAGCAAGAVEAVETPWAGRHAARRRSWGRRRLRGL